MYKHLYYCLLFTPGSRLFHKDQDNDMTDKKKNIRSSVNTWQDFVFNVIRSSVGLGLPGHTTDWVLCDMSWSVDPVGFSCFDFSLLPIRFSIFKLDGNLTLFGQNISWKWLVNRSKWFGCVPLPCVRLQRVIPVCLCSTVTVVTDLIFSSCWPSTETSVLSSRVRPGEQSCFPV